jgi:hypothetical protein
MDTADAQTTAGRISSGVAAPAWERSRAVVVGTSCSEAVLSTTKRIIWFEADRKSVV